MAVHGKDVGPSLEEGAALQPPCGDDYAESKAEAERRIVRAAGRGLPAVILRPTGVYGPFASILSARALAQLARGRLAVVGGDVRPAQTVYVDNVVAAI